MAASLLVLSTTPSDARPGGGQSFGGGAKGAKAGSPGGSTAGGTGGGSTYGGSGGGAGLGADGYESAADTTGESWAAANTPDDGDPAHVPQPPVDPNAPRMAEPRGPAKDRHKYAPTVFAGLMLFVGLVLVARSFRRKKSAPNETPEIAPRALAPRTQYVATQGSPRTRLAELAKVDPAFSVIVFEDFAQALYSEAVLAAGRDELARLSPYFSPAAERTMKARHLAGVFDVRIGASRMEDVAGLEAASAEVSAPLVFETSLARRDPATGEERTIYSVERWVLRRPKTARSRTPDKARVFGCPNCGAPPPEPVAAGRCRVCGEDVTTGAFDWRVASVEVLSAEERGPVLTGDTEERGTDLPTIVATDATSALDALALRDPGFSFDGFKSRLSATFHTFHETWSARDLTAMRPFLSEAQFATQSYWIAEYRSQLLRNVTENPTIRNVELARVASDAYFDAITVRLHASCIDYTVTESGALVSGDRSEPRAYTEYWTFVREREAKGPRFDWVLSRIEQDDVYRG